MLKISLNGLKVFKASLFTDGREDTISRPELSLLNQSFDFLIV